MKLYIKTFGCRVNQSESQSIIEALEKQGFELCVSYEDADVCILNTCTVTANADKDVEKLLRLINARNKFAKVFVTGCYAEIKKEEAKKHCANAIIVPNSQKSGLAALVLGSEEPAGGFGFSVTKSNERSRAFVKIQDGCDNACAFCIVHVARNIKQSKPLPQVLAEIDGLIKNGYCEIVLTGINVGNYLCPQTGSTLAGLLKEIFKTDKNFRIRLSSIEPLNVTEELLKVCAQAGEKFCPHFHLPLQAGSDSVLSKMNRHYITQEYAAVVENIRSKFKTPGIFADVIAGFPSETKEDFNKGYAFIENLKLSGLHVFSFSPRQGTPAAQMKQLSASEIKERASSLRSLDGVLRENFALSLVGTRQTVFVETADIDSCGLAGNFQKVIIKNRKVGPLVAVNIVSAFKAVCCGEAL